MNQTNDKNDKLEKLTKLISIEEAWLSYRARAIPPQAGPWQVKALKCTFYAGVCALRRSLRLLACEGIGREAEELALDRIDAEVVAFLEEKG